MHAFVGSCGADVDCGNGDNLCSITSCEFDTGDIDEDEGHAQVGYCKEVIDTSALLLPRLSLHQCHGWVTRLCGGWATAHLGAPPVDCSPG